MELTNGLIFNLKVISVDQSISKVFGKRSKPNKQTFLQQCKKVKIHKILFNLNLINIDMIRYLNNRLGTYNHKVSTKYNPNKTSINQIILMLLLSLIQICNEITKKITVNRNS